MLPAGGLLAIVETPNRLWSYDSHTAKLPFFHWLPDEVAFTYSRFSRRDNFREVYREYTESAKLHFLRRGCGVSFHEIELAICPLDMLNIVSSLGSSKRARPTSRDGRRYKRTMCKLFPHIHQGFLDEHLDLIIAREAYFMEASHPGLMVILQKRWNSAKISQ